jgi:hypothetical protein
MNRTGGQDEAGQRQQAEQSIHNDDKSLMSTVKSGEGTAGRFV